MANLCGLNDEVITADRVRYVGYPLAGISGLKNYGEYAMICMWQENSGSDVRQIASAYVMGADPKSTMIIVNAVLRLIYENSEKNVARTQKFYRLVEGPMDVATCHVDDREKRDKYKERQEFEKMSKSKFTTITYISFIDIVLLFIRIIIVITFCSIDPEGYNLD